MSAKRKSSSNRMSDEDDELLHLLEGKNLS